MKLKGHPSHTHHHLDTKGEHKCIILHAIITNINLI